MGLGLGLGLGLGNLPGGQLSAPPGTVLASTFYNQPSFFDAVVSAPLSAIVAGLLTVGQTFYDPAVSAVRVITPNLITNSQTFYDSVTANATAPGIAPALSTNTQTFYVPTLATAGTQDISPDMSMNSQSFFTASVADASALGTITMSWVSAPDNAVPEFDFDFAPPESLLAGDEIRFQRDVVSGDFSSPSLDISHPVTSDEIAAGVFDFGFTAWTAGSYDTRSRPERTGISPGSWSNTETVVIEGAAAGVILPGLVTNSQAFPAASIFNEQDEIFPPVVTTDPVLVVPQVSNMNIFYTATVAAPATGYRYWRLLSAVENNAGGLDLQEVEFLSGGVDVTGSGTPSQSSTQTGHAADKAFDNDTATRFWTDFTGMVGQWISYDFGSGNTQDITAFSITPQSADATFFQIALQYSTDGATWVNHYNTPVMTNADWSAGVKKTFTVANTGHRYWRVDFTDGIDATFIDIREIELRVGGADVTGYGTAAASSVDGGSVAARAFDNTNNRWIANGGGAEWISYDFGGDVKQGITTFAVKPEFAAYAATQVLLKYSDDGSSWTTAYTSGTFTSSDWADTTYKVFTV